MTETTSKTAVEKPATAQAVESPRKRTKTAPKAKVPAGKATVKKATKKTATKKTATKKAAPVKAKAEATANGRSRSMGTEAPGIRRRKLVQMLRKLGATKASSARSIDDLAGRCKYTRFDTYGLLRGTSGKADSNPRCLVAAGYAAVGMIEGQGLSAYLTAKGAKSKLEGAPFDG